MKVLRETMLIILTLVARIKWDLQTAPVASFKPNGYGLFDMAGNVVEQCQDWYDGDKAKVLRGGSMSSPCVLLPAATSIRLVGTTPAAFAVCQDQINISSFTSLEVATYTTVD